MVRRSLDCAATEMIPIRMIISIAIIAAIAAMVVVGYQYFSVVFAENQVANDCSEVESSLYSMVGSGNTRDVDQMGAGDGTTRVFSFSLPDNLVFLSFGVDPDPVNSGHLQTGLTENGSVICYKVSGGSKHVVWLPSDQFQFREGEVVGGVWNIHGDGEGFILTGGGKVSLTFELVKKVDHLYILIHASDTI